MCLTAQRRPLLGNLRKEFNKNIKDQKKKKKKEAIINLKKNKMLYHGM